MQQQQMATPMIGKYHERFNRSVVLAATIVTAIVTATTATATTAGTVQLQHLLIITTTITLLLLF